MTKQFLHKLEKDGFFDYLIDKKIMGGKKQLFKKSKKRSICWKGYHRVKGTAPYSKHSCAKN